MAASTKSKGGDQPAPADESAPAASPYDRTHIVSGRPCPVVDSYYNSKLKRVVDVVEYERTYVIKGKRFTETYQRVLSAPEDVQDEFKEKYGKGNIVRVSV